MSNNLFKNAVISFDGSCKSRIVKNLPISQITLFQLAQSGKERLRRSLFEVSKLKTFALEHKDWKVMSQMARGCQNRVKRPQ